MNRLASKLNEPALVTAAGVVTLVALPFLESGGLSSQHLGAVKAANLVAFLLNVLSVSVPGRVDGDVAKEMSRDGARSVLPDVAPPSMNESSLLTGGEGAGSGNAVAMSPGAGGRSFVAPAGWAFAIWAAIYIGEGAFVLYQLFAAEETPQAMAVGAVSAPFVGACIFQCLWCASFRKKYMDGSWTKWISPSMLGATAMCLSTAHSSYAGANAVKSGITRIEYVINFLAMSMHFGWTTAATLVNLNGSISWDGQTDASSLAYAGYTSAILATALGVGITVARSAPVYGATIAWALLACADGMSMRIEALTLASSATSLDESGELLAIFQRRLCRVGALASFGAAVAMTVFGGEMATNKVD